MVVLRIRCVIYAQTTLGQQLVEEEAGTSIELCACGSSTRYKHSIHIFFLHTFPCTPSAPHRLPHRLTL